VSPIRKNWSGLVPMRGEGGEYEWSGFLPTSELPHVFNPPQHYIATANHNILPRGYPHQLGYEWAAPFRFRRVDQVLKTGKKFTVEDFGRLQHDATSLEAQELVGLLKSAPPGGGEARKMLESWDGVIAKDSAAAALYEIWVRRLMVRFVVSRVPADIRAIYAARLNRRAMLDLIERDPPAERNALLLESFSGALSEARKLL